MVGTLNAVGLGVQPGRFYDHPHLLLGLQIPEQQSMGLEQAECAGRHVAACAGVGARIEVISGIAIAAPMPNRLTASRRVKRGTESNHSKGPSSK